MTNMAWVKGLLMRLDATLGGKADNLVNPIAWRRLPVGRNMKAGLGLGPQGWRVRSWLIRPDRVVDMLDCLDMDTLGTIVPMTTLNRGTGDGQRPDDAKLATDPTYQALNEGGQIIGDKITSDGFWAVTAKCPFIAEHGPTRPLSGCEYVPAIPGQRGWFHCFHCERKGRNQGAFREQLDIVLRDEGQKIVAAFEFEDVDPAAWAGQEAQEAQEAAQRVLGACDGTEDGLALAFAAEHAGGLRFDHLRQKWFVWREASYWQEDGTAQAFRWARQLARAFRRMPDASIKALGKIAVAGAIERAARADGRLAVDGKGWDPDPWLVGAPGCEVDLRTGTSAPPDPGHLITRQLGVAPQDQLTPVWDQFLWDCTSGDPAMIGFLQAWFGYCLTGDTSEEKFLFLYGPGGNGKTTFVRVMSDILGDYAVHAAADLLVVRKNNEHKTELAALRGARAVFPAELGDRETLNAGRVKDLTGGGTVAARGMRENMSSFVPAFKLVQVGNDQPRLENVDDAIRRRLVLALWTFKPPVPDLTLRDRLVLEYPGILMWAIKGELIRRNTVGGLAALVPPSAVAASNDYLDTEDRFKSWVEDECEFGVGPGFQMVLADAFEAYKSWCFSHGDQPSLALNQLSRKFLDVYPTCKRDRSKSVRLLSGVKLKA
jgi:putative DNA primase/helicase